MPDMSPGDEPRPPATADSPPPPENPTTSGAGPRCAPTPEDVLRWVAAGAPEPWFPSAHAKLTGTPRDSLDDPLTELRLADLVKIATWVRGVGQGYVLTPAGQAALGDPSVLAELNGPAVPRVPPG